ncbi:MAG: deoxyhypusine synthase family protein [Candidatus Daviesbacteria bacterium]|nr:MAG: deoxyhypusine synthase family protein [Candidatus Daviesbacteria bacterium]
MAKTYHLQKQKHYARNYQDLRKGWDDNLEPLKPLDVNKIKNFSDMAEAMSQTAFGGRIVGEAVDTLVAMNKDKAAFTVMTVAGAMTVAKMGLLICEMIDRGMVQALVVTGALMAHGLAEAAGMTHFKAPQDMSDDEMYLAGYDRVYDTVELEKNLDDTEEILFEILEGIPEEKVLSSRLITEEIGKYLVKNSVHRGVLKSAYLKGVPVYVPAFTDSELGLDLGMYNRARVKKGLPPRRYDPLIDLEHYTKLIWRQKKLGIFTIGGGVPRNFAQQVGPFTDLVHQRGLDSPEDTGKRTNGKKTYQPVMFTYGLRICPEPVYWGGLSGCTYSEGVSWGKFVPEKMGGRFAEVPSDATIIWPFILKAALERLKVKDMRKKVKSGKKVIKEIDDQIMVNYK